VRIINERINLSNIASLYLRLTCNMYSSSIMMHLKKEGNRIWFESWTS